MISADIIEASSKLRLLLWKKPSVLILRKLMIQARKEAHSQTTLICAVRTWPQVNQAGSGQEAEALQFSPTEGTGSRELVTL